MSFTRAQANAAKEALGLDPHLTHSITLTPTHVHVTEVALIDGHPSVRDGLTAMTDQTHEIEEAPNDDA